MPQMAPISWLIMFIIFSVTFIMFNILNYFCFYSLLPKQSSIKTDLTNPMIWKW